MLPFTFSSSSMTANFVLFSSYHQTSFGINPASKGRAKCPLTRYHKLKDNLFSPSCSCSSPARRPFLLKYFPCFDGNRETQETGKNLIFLGLNPGQIIQRVGWGHFSCCLESMCYQKTFRAEKMAGESRENTITLFSV